MKRIVPLVLAALTLATAVPAAGAQQAPARYSSASGISFALPDGWELRPVDPRPAPVLDVVSTVLPGQPRAASIVVTQLNGDSTGLTVDDYKALLDQAAAQRGEQIVQSTGYQVTAPNSPSGKWTGVLQVTKVTRDGTDYESARFAFPVADREYTVTATGLPGSAADDAETVGVLANSLALP